ncbi:MAG: dethiobiotin synthase [Cocleimonas sp.]
MKGLFVTATDTNVGKTWLGSRLITELKKLKMNVQARKPIESGWPISADVSETDAWKLASAMGQTDELDIVCPNRFSAALSPDRAAMLEGEIITLEQLYQDCLIGVDETDFLYVEGAGGFYSPICNDGLNADLAVSLGLPILLVVENRLGCINQALLNVEAIAKQGLNLSAIALNRPNVDQTDKAMDNFSDIQKRVDCEVIRFDYNQEKSDSIAKLAQLILAV